MRQVILNCNPEKLGAGWYYRKTVMFSPTTVPAFFVPFQDIAQELPTQKDVVTHFKQIIFQNLEFDLDYMTAFWKINMQDSTAVVYMKVENSNVISFFDAVLRKEVNNVNVDSIH